MPLVYTGIVTTVKPPRNFSIDAQVNALRLRVMAGEVALRFGQRMRQRRRELELTQKQVAARMPSGAPDGPVDAQRISDWERGYNEPTDRYKLELIAALDVPDVSYFYETVELDTPDLAEALGETGDDDRLKRIESKLDLLLVALAPSTEQQADLLARGLLAAGQAVEREREQQQRGKRGPGRRAKGRGDAGG
jgi:transcriptional regulator with XRE-family HTH domain